MKKRIIGLDLGKASVGWAYIEIDDEQQEGCILGAGARTFQIAANPKSGESPNIPRREARSARRRLRRHAHRLERIRALFVHEQLVPQDYLKDGYPDTEGCFAKLHKRLAEAGLDPWRLRSEGLERRLNPEEWVVVLTHLAQRRGFRSNSKREEASTDTDDKNQEKQEKQKMKSGILANQELLNSGHYRTIGEMFYRDSKFCEHKRNKRADYAHTVARADLQQEIEVLFRNQRTFDNQYANDTFEQNYSKIWSDQRHYDQGGNIVKMIGKCTLEPKEPRSPSRGYTAECVELWQNINNLRMTDNEHTEINLSDDERDRVAQKAYTTQRITYKTLRTLLSLPEDTRFKGLDYNPKRASWKGTEDTQDTKAPQKKSDPESKAFVELGGWHGLRKAVCNSIELGSERGIAEWQRLSTDPAAMDAIVAALTYYKNDDNVRAETPKLYATYRKIYNPLAADVAWDYPPELIEAILPLNFSKTKNLSIKVLARIAPHLKRGLSYDQACTAAGYDFQAVRGYQRTILLPPIPSGEIANPGVMRGLTQTRKVLNAIIRKYGSPHAIHIELLRDLAHSQQEINKIKKEQGEYQNYKQQAVDHFRELFGHDPGGGDLQKFRLYKEQNGICPYSGTSMDIMRLQEPGYVDIDHILPYSRSCDDSQANKVLCMASENRQKGNQTPCEYLGGPDSPRFAQLITRVERYRQAKRNRLQRRTFSDEEAQEYRERQVERSESKYIARFFKNFVQQKLQFADSTIKNRVQTRNGALTGFLRARWGLIKIRSDGDTHHALDAIVIACATQGMVQQLMKHSRKSEVWTYNDPDAPSYTSIDTHSGAEKQSYQEHRAHQKQFPLPWQSFRDDLDRTMEEIFVSRPPRRRVRGEAHAATIQSVRQVSEPDGSVKRTVVKRIALQGLTQKNIELIFDKEGSNRNLYRELKRRLALHGDAKKAFPQDGTSPFVHPDIKDQIVRHVRIEASGASGVTIRGGLAGNSEMLRTDVFRRDNEFWLVPVYPSHRLKGQLPDRAIVSRKGEDDWPQIDDSFEFLSASASTT